MDYSYVDSLCERIDEVVEWKPHFDVVWDYVDKLKDTNHEFTPDEELPLPEERSYPRELIRQLFKVPNLDKLYVKNNANALEKKEVLLDKKEVLAAFIHFLLQLLSQKTKFVHPFKDRIGHLKKELRYLLTILGDRPLLCDELEQAKNILAEFESVANEAGSFVYSYISATDEGFVDTSMNDTLGALFSHIGGLIGNIFDLSVELSHINKITPEMAVVDSLFIVDSLLHDLKHLMNQKQNLIVEVKDEIEKLHQHLMLSQSILKGIKVPRHLDIKEFKQIRDLAYEAEYLVNSFLAGYVPWEYLAIRLPNIIRRIRYVGIESQEIKKNYDSINLKVAEDLNAQLSSQAQRNLDVYDVNIMVGSEDKTIHVLDHLVGGPRCLQTIVIFGMPGLGKTTLAKKLYSHGIITDHFHRCSFIVVSQTYQRKNLLIDILISLGTELDKVQILGMEEELLAERIHKILKGRRYFIVMDDVWDSNVWDNLRRYFPDDRNGSRILFTSRNKNVAPPNSIIYELSPLSNDECWELLQKKVFDNKPCPPQLIGIGKTIAASCNGLPLAVVVIAGVLSTMDKEESAWENVKRSLTSYILSDQNNPTMQILKLSYTHLPDHLKPCFLYFGIFPEDREILVNKLKCLWIAERFIKKEGMLKDDDSLAEDFLMELINRSLVKVTKRGSSGRAKICIVHDLLRDLCLRIAEEENFLMLTECERSVYTRHHRLKTQDMFSVPFGCHLRSLFVSQACFWSWDFLNLNLLIVLDMEGDKLKYVDGNEHQAHLRYLAVEDIPKPIGSFTNLEFLIVRGIDVCSVSVSLIIKKLVKLKYLRVIRTDAYFDERCHSYQTNNLEYLATVSICKGDEKMLKCSPHLRILKCGFKKLRYEHEKHPDLRFLTHLESLNVNNLNVGFGGEINFPSNINKLTLRHSYLPVEMMSIIGGLPKLEVLKLADVEILGGIWDTRDGEFQQLRFLKLTRIKITQWNVESKEHFPRLQQLILWSCENLEEIPNEIGEIETLQLIELWSCKQSMAESATKIKQEQEEMGYEGLNVIIRVTLNS